MFQQPRLLLDGKQIKNVTTTEINLARHVVLGSKATGEEDISFGFSTLQMLEEWLGKQSSEEQKRYKFLNQMRALTIKATTITPEEEEKIKAFQINMVSTTDDEITSRGLNAKLQLYQSFNYEDKHLYLATGAYHDLGHFDFDNRTSSYMNPAGCFVFCQYKWFGGKRLYCFVPRNNPSLNWWNNRLTSLLYASDYDIIKWLIWLLL